MGLAFRKSRRRVIVVATSQGFGKRFMHHSTSPVPSSPGTIDIPRKKGPLESGGSAQGLEQHECLHLHLATTFHISTTTAHGGQLRAAEAAVCTTAAPPIFVAHLKKGDEDLV